jgi:parvulin-like peptidyl-prolyl isomerase
MVQSLKDGDPALSTGSPQAQTALKNLRATVLDRLIMRQLLKQEAARQHIQVSSHAVDKEMQNTQGTMSDAQFAAELAREGKSRDDLRQLLAETNAIDQLLDSWIADVVVSEDELSAFYKAHPDDFVTPESVHVRHILLAVTPVATSEEKLAIEKHAEAVLKLALAPNADFSALAKQYSEDPGSKPQGGDLGFFTRDMMVKPFSDAAFAGTPGLVIPHLVESTFGFHIIKVEEKAASQPVALSDVRDKLHAYLLQQKRTERIGQRQDELLANSKVKKYI